MVNTYDWDLSSAAGAPTQIMLAGEAREMTTPTATRACVVEPDATYGAWELRRSVMYDGDWFAVDRSHHRTFFLGSQLDMDAALAAFGRLAGGAE